jgi:peptidoglycan/LPS O-acetylase OafA/YrhL
MVSSAGHRAGQRTLEYRPHLDGVRAIAVLSVFVFHASPAGLPGGFIGVDIFFVLSGYLITLILLEHRSPAALGPFYVRRIKRLLPAALVLLLVVAIRESLWGAVVELDTRFREIRATTLYVANWFFIGRSDDYFAESESVSPLRHMWSLAVEEQFYLAWPLLLTLLVWLCRRRLGLPGAVAVALATASAVAMVVLYSPANVARAYYGTDTRVFQPLLGAILAIGTVWLARRPRQPSSAGAPAAMHGPIVPTALGVAAVVALGLMAFRLDGSESSYFHSGAMLVAASAAALIWAIERSRPLAAVIGWWPLAALGRISYGVYLWHWPIILWVRPGDGADWLDRRVVNLAQLALTLAVAMASYVLIERPIRMRRLRGPNWHVFGVAALSMAMVIGSSSWLLRPPTTGREATMTAAADDTSVEHCPDLPHPCVMYDPGVPSAPTVALVGDSTAQMYRPALLALAEQYGFRFVQEAMGGCPVGDRLIATGIDGELHKPSNLMCYEAIPGTYEDLLSNWQVSLVIATAWNESNRHVTDGVLVEAGTDRHRAEMSAALEQSIDLITSQGARIAFVDVLPPGPFLQCLETSAPDEGACLRAIVTPSPIEAVNQEFRRLADERDEVLGVVDLLDVICPGGAACPLAIDDVVVRYDGTHFTGTWSRNLAPVLDQRLRDLGVDLAQL